VPHRSFRHVAAVACATALAFTTSGCAGTVTQWMVNLRTSQGDAALERLSLPEAQKEYDLALKLDPHNEHARAGLAKVLFLQARADFSGSKLDTAEADVAEARKYAPGDAATEALANQIEQAKIRREIVLANYPLYEAVGTSLSDSLKTLAATQKEIATQLKAFRSDFDTRHLSKAIAASYDLEDEAHRVTLRLTSYRALVASGAPKGQAKPPTQSETPNLLPIP
jgi:tetratricopeptide (TPR) repeat protein